jgi:hypothetical protein
LKFKTFQYVKTRRSLGLRTHASFQVQVLSLFEQVFKSYGSCINLKSALDVVVVVVVVAFSFIVGCGYPAMPT